MTFISQLFTPEFWITQPWMVVLSIFQIWMLVHAIRNREWLWAVFIFIGWSIAAFWYFFSVYRHSAGSGQFELPGAGTRQRIKELEAKIHHLDNAHHHLQLGDVYFRKGKFAKAEQCYRASLEREPGDIDARAHLGQALLRQDRPAEAKPLLEQVCRENPKHDYSYTLMAYAETLMALKETDAALCAWQQVLQNNSYPRAKVQVAEIYAERGQNDLARAELKEVVNDDVHAPKFQRRRDRAWIRRAKSLLRKVGKA